MNVDVLEAILYRHDPAGLTEAGIPADEYRAEAETIVPRLKDAASVEDVQRIMHEEFATWFNEEIAGDAERYEAPAREVWAAVHS